MRSTRVDRRKKTPYDKILQILVPVLIVLIPLLFANSDFSRTFWPKVFGTPQPSPTATESLPTANNPALLAAQGGSETPVPDLIGAAIQPIATSTLPANCLTSREWQFSPISTVNQVPCLDLLPYFVSYAAGQFDFSVPIFKEVNVYGISREIPLKATIEATYTVDELVGGGRLWLGVTSDIDPQKNSLMFVIQPDRYIALRSISGGNSRDLVSAMSAPYFFDKPRKDYVIRLEIDYNRIDVVINGARLYSTVLDFTNRRLFLGYQSVRDVRLSIRASLHDLSVK